MKKSPKVKMKIREAKRDWSAETAEQDGTAETVPTERLDRDPSEHLGAAIAAVLMPTKGNA